MKTAHKLAALVAGTLFTAVLTALPFPSPAPGQQARTLSAGIGKGDRTVRRDFSLKLVFARKQGSFTAGVRVTIFDQDGNRVLETFSEGPWLFVDLPEGNYRVVARPESGGGAAGEVEVTAGRQKALYLTW